MLGKRLKSLRKEKRWTIEEVSTMLSISKSTYSGYETESRQPPIDKLQRISKIYNVSIDYLLGLIDDVEPKKVESNLKEYLEKGNLHWNGAPLTEEELKPIKDLLEIVARKLPKYKNL